MVWIQWIRAGKCLAETSERKRFEIYSNRLTCWFFHADISCSCLWFIPSMCFPIFIGISPLINFESCCYSLNISATNTCWWIWRTIKIRSRRKGASFGTWSLPKPVARFTSVVNCSFQPDPKIKWFRCLSKTCLKISFELIQLI